MRTARDSLFSLSLAAFAAIGLPVTFCSSAYELIRMLRRASSERVGEAINLGTAAGLALGFRLDWAILTTTAFSGLVVAWVALREEPPRPQPEDVDEDFVRRLEALAGRMRQELEARRAS